MIYIPHIDANPNSYLCLIFWWFLGSFNQTIHSITTLSQIELWTSFKLFEIVRIHCSFLNCELILLKQIHLINQFRFHPSYFFIFYWFICHLFLRLIIVSDESLCTWELLSIELRWSLTSESFLIDINSLWSVSTFFRLYFNEILLWRFITLPKSNQLFIFIYKSTLSYA